MIVLLGLTMVAQHVHSLRQLRVVGCDRSAFAASAEVLTRIKAKCRGLSHGTSFFPCVLPAREVFGAMRLAGILDNNQIEAFGYLQDSVHIGHLPVEMHRDDRRDCSASPAGHWPPSKVIV